MREADSGSASFLPDVLNAADEPEILLDVAGFMHRAPLCVHLDHPATRVHLLFTTHRCLRPSVVNSRCTRVAGVITRKDVTRAELGVN